jgi:2-polyprenyl-6-methoxyphenol hydroxylase-like FAD-dependent oxidoreductase
VSETANRLFVSATAIGLRPTYPACNRHSLRGEPTHDRTKTPAFSGYFATIRAAYVIGADGAHIHSPAGGQGMNTGMQDAAKLAWKLLARLRGRGSNALLNSYQAERLPIAHEVLKFTDRLFNLAACQRGWQAHLRDWLAPLVLDIYDASAQGVFNIAAPNGYVSIDKARRVLGWDPDFRLKDK